MGYPKKTYPRGPHKVYQFVFYNVCIQDTERKLELTLLEQQTLHAIFRCSAITMSEYQPKFCCLCLLAIDFY